MTKTTKRYPYTLAQANEAIRQSTAEAPNEASAPLSYRATPPGGGGLIAYSYLRSPHGERYRRIAFAS